MSEFMPTLLIVEIGGRVRLGLGGFSYSEGATLQEAADELLRNMRTVALAFRSGAMNRFSSACPPDAELLEFLWELGEIAAAGGDIRNRLFGPSTLAA